MMTVVGHLPPGLRDLAKQENLTLNEIEQLKDIWWSIRGRRPQTLTGWMPLYEVIKREYWPEETE
jgi:hypothetical protein